MANGVSRRSHDFRTSREVNRNGWGGCERALKLPPGWKGLSGKAKAKTGIGKSDLPGLQGGPRKRDLVLKTKCARLGSIPTRWRRPATIAVIPGGGKGDRPVESPGVKVSVGLFRSDPSGRRATLQVVARAKQVVPKFSAPRGTDLRRVLGVAEPFPLG
jgi:hypothetical protein